MGKKLAPEYIGFCIYCSALAPSTWKSLGWHCVVGKGKRLVCPLCQQERKMKPPDLQHWNQEVMEDA